MKKRRRRLIEFVNPFDLRDKVIQKAAEIAANKLRIVKQDSRSAEIDYRQDYGFRSGHKLETEEDFLTAYRRCVWIYGCVNTIAQSIAGLPLRIYTGRGEERNEIKRDDGGEVWDLLGTPSPGQTLYDLLEATVTDMELMGDAYWELTRGDSSKTIRLINWLFPHRMKILPKKEGGILGYTYTVTGSPISYKPEEILHFKYFNPRSKLYGHSPMQAIAGSALTLFFYQLAYEKNFFKAGARLSAFVSIPEDVYMNSDMVKRFRGELRELYGGVEKAHKIGVFEHGMKLEEYGTKPIDIGLEGLRTSTLQDVLIAYQVPAAMFNLIENRGLGTGQETEAQKKSFWQETIKPKLVKIQTKIDTLLHEFDENYYCEFDLSGVESLRENEEIKAKIRQSTAIAAMNLVKTGILTINEVRAEWYGGKKEVDWGSEPPAPSSPFGLAASQDLKKKDDRLNWKEWAEEARKFENKLFAKLVETFGDLEKKVLANVKAKVKKQKGPVDALLFDLSAEGLVLMEAVRVFIQDAMEFFGQNGMQRIRMGPSFDLYDKRALKVLKDHIEDYFGSRGVLVRLREALTSELKEGYKLGESMKLMTERVQGVFEGYVRGSATRARMIARSETIRAANGATQLAWEQSGIVTGKKWLAAGDACEACLEMGRMSETQLAESFKFDKGSKFADFEPVAYPPLHPNCRCTVVAVT